MTEIIGGLLVAFGLYSALPLPQIEWKQRTMRYALGFMPLIGLMVGACQYGWLQLANWLGLNAMLYAAIAVLVPVVVTGGIHLDGFVDTCDALCSYGEREKRLEILKDPHVGAFGVMWLVVLLIVQFGLFAQLYDAPGCASLLLVGYAAARAFGGALIVTQRCAKDSGLAYLFANGSDKKAVSSIMLVWKLVCAVLFVLLGRLFGALTICAMIAFDAYHKRKCRAVFGGVTGDLCGMCITVCELLTLILSVAGGVVYAVIA